MNEYAPTDAARGVEKNMLLLTARHEGRRVSRRAPFTADEVAALIVLGMLYAALWWAL